MALETVAEKAARYLAEGRLTIFRADDTVINAFCSGTGGLYRCGYDPDGWHCTCPAHGPVCSHIEALRLVTVNR